MSTADNIRAGLEACIRDKVNESQGGPHSHRGAENVGKRLKRKHSNPMTYDKSPTTKIPNPTMRVNAITNHGSKLARHDHNTNHKPAKPTIPMSDQKQRLVLAAKFLKDNYDKDEQELTRLVKTFPYKNELYNIVDHMIATALGGWHKEGDQLVNETGHIANPENWTLTEDGVIKSKGGKRIESIDNLLVIREITNGYKERR